MPVDAGENDTGRDAGWVPEGLGEVCLTRGFETECIDHEASFCLVEPGETDGYCTIGDCTVAPNDCPDGYKCCNMPVEGMPNFCAIEDDFFKMGSMCEQ
jgi:hypothetical protein